MISESSQKDIGSKAACADGHGGGLKHVFAGFAFAFVFAAVVAESSLAAQDVQVEILMEVAEELVVAGVRPLLGRGQLVFSTDSSQHGR